MKKINGLSFEMYSHFSDIKNERSQKLHRKIVEYSSIVAGGVLILSVLWLTDALVNAWLNEIIYVTG